MDFQFAQAQAQLRPLCIKGRQPLLVGLAKFFLLDGQAFLFRLDFLEFVNTALKNLETQVRGKRGPVFAGHKL